MNYIWSIFFIIFGSILGGGLAVFVMQKLHMPSIIDHTSFSVSNLQKSGKFYDETLATLGYKRWGSFGDVILYGTAQKPSFSISTKGNPQEQLGNARGVHVAFAAPNRAAVDAWYAKALALGGKDNGKPGLRSEYHPYYYAAFIIDTDGWRTEAVCHKP